MIAIRPASIRGFVTRRSNAAKASLILLAKFKRSFPEQVSEMARRRKLSTTKVPIPSPLSVFTHPFSVPEMPLQPCMRMTTDSGSVPGGSARKPLTVAGWISLGRGIRKDDAPKSIVALGNEISSPGGRAATSALPVAAARADMSAIGFLCGGSTEEELRESGCIALYHDPADLLAQYEKSPFSKSWRCDSDQ